MKGIYKYTDLETKNIVYIGKDSNIDKSIRHRAHLRPSTYNKQPFNRVLQNNHTRYEYSVLYMSDDVSDDDLNMLEMSFIERYNPKFNFTTGGDGGYKLSEETKQKISESHKGKGNPFYGKSHSEESKKKISESHTKHYARICKKGFTSNGKQNYAIRKNGVYIKRSISIDNLKKWFSENYPNEKLEVNI